MTLKVHNFYIKDKLSTNRYHNLLMANALFYILISENGRFRELSLQVAKKFRYDRFVGYGNFSIEKADEYNVLVDFITNNKAAIKEKWHLDEGSFSDLLDGLKIVLIRNYSTCSGLHRILLELPIVIKRFIRLIVRRIKT